MAQSAITVRIDSDLKTQFDALCEQFGMSANTAFNIFVKAVIRLLQSKVHLVRWTCLCSKGVLQN